MGTSAFYPVTWGDCPQTTSGGKGWELPRSILLHGETVHRLNRVERDGNFRVLSCYMGRLSTNYTGWKGMGTSAFYPVSWGDCPQTTSGGKGWELTRPILFPLETVLRLQREERDGNFRVLSCYMGRLSRLNRVERHGNFCVLSFYMGRLSTNYTGWKGMGTSAFYPVTWGDCLQTTPGGKGWELPRSILLPGETVHRLNRVERDGETVHKLQQEERDGNFHVLSCYLSTDYIGRKGMERLSTNYNRRKGMGTSAFYPVTWRDCPQTTSGGKR